MRLQEEIREAVDSIKNVEPVYERIGSQTYDLQDVDMGPAPTLRDIVWKYSDVSFNFDTKRFEVKDKEHTVNHVKQYIKKMILSWIQNSDLYTNPKLSKTYRWYCEQDLTDAMYTLYRYMAQHSSQGFYDSFQIRDKHQINISKLIQWIELRGE